MPDFCVFLPSNFEVDGSNAKLISDYLNEKNSLQILNNTCSKNKCNLEFEIKTKSTSSTSTTKSTRVTISGSSCLQQSESESETSEQQGVKYK